MKIHRGWKISEFEKWDIQDAVLVAWDTSCMEQGQILSWHQGLLVNCMIQGKCNQDQQQTFSECIRMHFCDHLCPQRWAEATMGKNLYRAEEREVNWTQGELRLCRHFLFLYFIHIFLLYFIPAGCTKSLNGSSTQFIQASKYLCSTHATTLWRTLRGMLGAWVRFS